MKRIKVFLCIAIAGAFLAVGLVIAAKTSAMYRIQDTLSRAFASVPFDVCTVETQPFPIDVLRNDRRIVFDQTGMLVNASHKLGSDFVADIAEYKTTGVMMNSAMLDAYAQLSQQVRERFGQKLYVGSSYRTAQEQARVLREEGDKAVEVGASEHQTGLALDVYVKYFAGMGFIKSEVGQWINSHCWQYGFIIRYPYYAPNADGVGYEPWHIRYVGKPHAEIMYKKSMTLEAYFDLLSDGQWRKCGNDCISRQSGEEIELPAHFASATISPDNAGGYLVCAHVIE